MEAERDLGELDSKEVEEAGDAAVKAMDVVVAHNTRTNTLHCNTAAMIVRSKTSKLKTSVDLVQNALRDARNAVGAAKELASTPVVDAAGKADLLARADALEKAAAAFEPVAATVKDGEAVYASKVLDGAKAMTEAWCPMWDYAKKLEEPLKTQQEKTSAAEMARADAALARSKGRTELIRAALSVVQAFEKQDTPEIPKGFEAEEPRFAAAKTAHRAAIKTCR